MDSKLLTVKQLSELLQIHEKTLYRHTREGLIPFVSVGGALRYDPSEVSDALKARTEVRKEVKR